MAWTAPITWATRQLVTAADLNAQLRDNLILLKTSIDNNGKLVALSATYLADLSGANITGVAKLAAANSYAAGKQDFNAGSTTRLVVPVGADKWAT